MRYLKLLTFLLLFSCNDYRYFDYQPVNPPMNLEITMLGSGDYLVTFYSENRNNKRFGGFMVFMDPSADALYNMTSIDNAADVLEGSTFNLGIDSPVAVLYSDNTGYDSIVNGYTITVTKPGNILIQGEMLALRAFLYDENGDVLDISALSNIVQIP